MKKATILLLTIALCAGINLESKAQKVQKSPKSVLTQTVGLTDLTITYYRPGLKGREMSSMVKNGEVWRTGANNATEITISNPVSFAGQELAAGTYSMYTIPGDGEWTVIINSKQSWGTQYDKAADVMRFAAKVSQTAETTETLTIDISDIDANGKDAQLELRWGNLSVKAPFTVSE